MSHHVLVLYGHCGNFMPVLRVELGDVLGLQVYILHVPKRIFKPLEATTVLL